MNLPEYASAASGSGALGSIASRMRLLPPAPARLMLGFAAGATDDAVRSSDRMAEALATLTYAWSPLGVMAMEVGRRASGAAGAAARFMAPPSASPLPPPPASSPASPAPASAPPSSPEGVPPSAAGIGPQSATG